MRMLWFDIFLLCPLNLDGLAIKNLGNASMKFGPDTLRVRL